MTQWREVALGEAVEVRHGFAFRGEYFRDHGEMIVVTPGNFHDGGGFRAKSGGEKHYDGPVPPGYVLSKGDVIVAMTEQATGLLGSSATVPSDSRYLHNQRLGLLRIIDPGKLDLRFCYHLMNTPIVRQQIQATATGSKVRHTAPERLQAVRVLLPDVPTQRVIAGILDAVDDLAENNGRRIELLEQMAQAIYREWFVHLRYPGYEDATLIDSPLGPIPTEWQVVTIGQAVELHYGKALRANNRMGGRVAVIGSSGVVGHHDEELVEGPAIVVGRKGNVGNIIWSPRACWPIDTTYYVSTHLPLRYVYGQLRRAAFMNTHAAVPGLSREQAYSLPFLLPPPRLMSMFANFSNTLGALVVPLTEQMQRLVWIRDLLLPKLVTGQIDVSRLDLDVVVESVT